MTAELRETEDGIQGGPYADWTDVTQSGLNFFF
jgi:hypothetical protein